MYQCPNCHNFLGYQFLLLYGIINKCNCSVSCSTGPAPPTFPMTTPELNTEDPSYTTQETTHTEGSSYTTQETIHPEEASSHTTQETRTQGQPRAAIVGGAVGGGLGILVALLLLAIVVAAILIISRRRYVCN